MKIELDVLRGVYVNVRNGSGNYVSVTVGRVADLHDEEDGTDYEEVK